MMRWFIILVLCVLLWTDKCCKQQHTLREDSRPVSIDSVPNGNDWKEEYENSGSPTIKQ